MGARINIQGNAYIPPIGNSQPGHIKGENAGIVLNGSGDTAGKSSEGITSAWKKTAVRFDRSPTSQDLALYFSCVNYKNISGAPKQPLHKNNTTHLEPGARTRLWWCSYGSPESFVRNVLKRSCNSNGLLQTASQSALSAANGKHYKQLSFPPWRRTQRTACYCCHFPVQQLVVLTVALTGTFSKELYGMWGGRRLRA